MIPDPPFVSTSSKIIDVIEALEADDVGALVVSDDGNMIRGIISERDVVRGLQRFGITVLEKPVSELMTKQVITCTAEDPVAGVMAIMNENNIRHVPVLKQGKFIAVVSILDIIRLRMIEVQYEADTMRSYISAA